MAQTRSQNKTAAKQSNIDSIKKPRVLICRRTAVNNFVVRCYRDLALIGLFALAILYFLAYLIGSDHLSYFSQNCTVCLFVKKSPIRYFGWVRGKNNICHLIVTDLSIGTWMFYTNRYQRTRHLVSFKKLKSILISKQF